MWPLERSYICSTSYYTKLKTSPHGDTYRWWVEIHGSKSLHLCLWLNFYKIPKRRSLCTKRQQQSYASRTASQKILLTLLIQLRSIDVVLHNTVTPGPLSRCLLSPRVEAEEEELTSKGLVSIDVEGEVGGWGGVNTGCAKYKGIPSNEASRLKKGLRTESAKESEWKVQRNTGRIYTATGFHYRTENYWEDRTEKPKIDWKLKKLIFFLQKLIGFRFQNWKPNQINILHITITWWSKPNTPYDPNNASHFHFFLLALHPPPNRDLTFTLTPSH